MASLPTGKRIDLFDPLLADSRGVSKVRYCATRCIKFRVLIQARHRRRTIGQIVARMVRVGWVQARRFYRLSFVQDSMGTSRE